MSQEYNVFVGYPQQQKINNVESLVPYYVVAKTTKLHSHFTWGRKINSFMNSLGPNAVSYKVQFSLFLPKEKKKEKINLYLKNLVKCYRSKSS